MNIESQLEEVFRATFGQSQLRLTRELCPGDLSTWDSLSQVRLIVAIEKSFAIKIPTHDLVRLRSAGDFIDMITERLNGKGSQ